MEKLHLFVVVAIKCVSTTGTKQPLTFDDSGEVNKDVCIFSTFLSYVNVRLH